MIEVILNAIAEINSWKQIRLKWMTKLSINKQVILSLG